MNTPIVMQGLPRWDGAYQSTAIQLAKELSKSRMVIYVEHPYTWKDFLQSGNESIQRRKILFQGQERGALCERPFPELPNFVNIVPRPVPPINFLPEGELFERVREHVCRQLWRQIDQVLGSLGVESFIYINSFDPVYSKVYSSKKVLLQSYHCVDNIAGERYIARHGVNAEQTFLKSCDLVIGTSEALVEKCAVLATHAYTVHNAADVALFSKFTGYVPQEMEAIGGKILLYVGNLGLRLDYAFIEAAALAHPEWNFVFIGPEDKREFKGQSLKRLNNVYFLGAKPYLELPAYIHAADACWIPFCCDSLTRYIYPLKLNEYLAAGKPVLATPFAPFGELERHVYLYNDLETFDAALQRSLNNQGLANHWMRLKSAMPHTWANRAKRFAALLDDAVAG